MKVKLIVIGKIKDKNINNIIDEYKKRLKLFCNLEIVELKDNTMIKEEIEIRKHMNSNNNSNNNFLLDEKGLEYSSLLFSELFKEKEEICFIIGGPNGTSDEFKKENNCLALSKMTLTHEMARTLLIEQIYRSFMILNNRKYHK